MIYHWDLFSRSDYMRCTAFVIHKKFGALSAAVMIGHYMKDICSTI